MSFLKNLFKTKNKKSDAEQDSSLITKLEKNTKNVFLCEKPSNEPPFVAPQEDLNPTQDAVDAFKTAIMRYISQNKLQILDLANNLTLTTSLSDETAIKVLEQSLSAPWKNEFIPLLTMRSGEGDVSIHLTINALLNKKEIWLYSSLESIGPSFDYYSQNYSTVSSTPTIRSKYASIGDIPNVLNKELSLLLKKQTENLYYHSCP